MKNSIKLIIFLFLIGSITHSTSAQQVEIKSPTSEQWRDDLKYMAKEMFQRHKNLGDNNLGVVGAYPNGMRVDVLRAEPGDRPQADKNIAAVPLPETDPLQGTSNGLQTIWK